jgi:predicted XRE-type DNA-binding protein
MKTEKLETVSLKELAEESGVNYEVFKIKRKLIKKIKAHCKKEKISQRSLAKSVSGLTQDRVSKIFSGQVGGMTIDKLIIILDALKIKVNLSLKHAA